MSNILTIAMPKGRIFEEAVELLRKAGYKLPPEFDDSRKLILNVAERLAVYFSQANGCGYICGAWCGRCRNCRKGRFT